MQQMRRAAAAESLLAGAPPDVDGPSERSGRCSGGGSARRVGVAAVLGSLVLAAFGVVAYDHIGPDPPTVPSRHDILLSNQRLGEAGELLAQNKLEEASAKVAEAIKLDPDADAIGVRTP